MRWSIRFQLLVPLLTLLVGVVGMSVWTALASADGARRQIEKQMHDIARTVAALLSDDTAFVTGEVLKVDGGYSLAL